MWTKEGGEGGGLVQRTARFGRSSQFESILAALLRTCRAASARPLSLSFSRSPSLAASALRQCTMDEPGLSLARRGAAASRATITAVAAASAIFLKYASRLQTYGLDRFTRLVTPPAAGVHPRQGRPLITISNHTSCVDDPVLMGSLPWPRLLRTTTSGSMRWTPGSKRICYSNPLLGYFFGMGQVIPVSWGEGVFQEGMRIAQERLDRGDWVHIFPEGRVNQTGRIWPFKWGVGQLVLETTRRHGVGPILLLLVHSGTRREDEEEGRGRAREGGRGNGRERRGRRRNRDRR